MRTGFIGLASSSGGLPSVPGIVREVSAIGFNQGVDLSWIEPVSNGGSNITDYEVEVSTDLGESWAGLTQTGSTSPFYSYYGLVNDASYLFRVRAVNAIGAGPFAPLQSSVLVGNPEVTGGTLTSDSTYYYRTFTSNGTLSISNVPLNIEYIVVAGGTGGGIAYVPFIANPPLVAAAGGGGSLVTSGSSSQVSGSLAVVVGAGGAGSVTPNGGAIGQYGGTSSLGAIAERDGVNTAATGGFAYGSTQGVQTLSTRIDYRFGASGPGAAEKGEDATFDYGTSTGSAGSGGDGADPWSIGSLYGGGGGASGKTFFTSLGPSPAVVTAGLGGSGGGGNGGDDTNFPTAGAVNSGGGGGGARSYSNPDPAEQGGNGGSGVVVVRYLKRFVG